MRGRPFHYLGSFVLATSVVMQAGESKEAEVLRAYSPDKKFAMRILCDAEYAEKEEIPSNAVRSITLVTLPGKKEAAALLSAEDAGLLGADATLVWSVDSQWCAFYSQSRRIGYTTIFRRKGERFARVPGDDDLRADAVENVRNEYISPVRWLKPGALVLEQYSMTRGDSEDLHVHFTATYDAKSRKFRISGVKKVVK